jgi:hypothetical protein
MKHYYNPTLQSIQQQPTEPTSPLIKEQNSDSHHTWYNYNKGNNESSKQANQPTNQRKQTMNQASNQLTAVSSNQHTTK